MTMFSAKATPLPRKTLLPLPVLLFSMLLSSPVHASSAQTGSGASCFTFSGFLSGDACFSAVRRALLPAKACEVSVGGVQPGLGGCACEDPLAAQTSEFSPAAQRRIVVNVFGALAGSLEPLLSLDRVDAAATTLGDIGVRVLRNSVLSSDDSSSSTSMGSPSSGVFQQGSRHSSPVFQLRTAAGEAFGEPMGPESRSVALAALLDRDDRRDDRRPHEGVFAEEEDQLDLAVFFAPPALPLRLVEEALEVLMRGRWKWALVYDRFRALLQEEYRIMERLRPVLDDAAAAAAAAADGADVSSTDDAAAAADGADVSSTDGDRAADAAARRQRGVLVPSSDDAAAVAPPVREGGRAPIHVGDQHTPLYFETVAHKRGNFL